MTNKYDYRIKLTITENYSRWYMPQRRARKWYGIWRSMKDYIGGGFDKKLGCKTKPQAQELIRKDKMTEENKANKKKNRKPASTSYITIND